MMSGRKNSKHKRKDFLTIAVRDNRVSRRIRSPIVPLKPLGRSQHYHIEGFKGGLQLDPHYAGKRTTDTIFLQSAKLQTFLTARLCMQIVFMKEKLYEGKTL